MFSKNEASPLMKRVGRLFGWLQQEKSCQFHKNDGESFFAQEDLGQTNSANCHASSHKSLTLAQLQEGSLAKVLRVRGGGAIRQRLLDMGIGKGAKVKIVRYAPLMDPIQVSVRGYDLALRVNECSLIDVEPCPACEESGSNA